MLQPELLIKTSDLRIQLHFGLKLRNLEARRQSICQTSTTTVYTVGMLFMSWYAGWESPDWWLIIYRRRVDVGCLHRTIWKTNHKKKTKNGEKETNKQIESKRETESTSLMCTRLHHVAAVTSHLSFRLSWTPALSPNTFGTGVSS